MNDTLKVIGSKQPVTDVENKVSGKTLYTADIKLPGMLHAKILRSPHAHARVLSVDTSEAMKMPGVRAIAHPYNTKQYRYIRTLKFSDNTDKQQMSTEYVYPRVVRFVGERVAAVAADTEKQAQAALKKIKVEYEVLPAVLSIDEALNPDSIQIHDHLKNCFVDFKYPGRGDVDEAFKNADYIIEDTYTTPIVNHVPIETHACIADYDKGGKVTIITPTQAAFSVRGLLSNMFDLPMNKIRIIKPPIGGAFGSKVPAILEPQAFILSRMTGKPVKIVLTRKEVFLVNTRHASKIKVKSGVMKDGTLIAHEIDSVINTGAHNPDGLGVAGALGSKSFYMYKVPNMRVRSRAVMTNLPSAGAMRGYGSPQVYFAQQSHIQKVAKTIGMDLVDFQEKNAITTEFMKGEIGNTKVLECVQRGREIFHWDDRKKSLTSDETIKRGIGMSIACHGNGVYKVHPDFAGITLKANEDGTFILHTGAHEMGTGIIKTQMMLAAEILQIDVSKLSHVEADTDVVPYNIGDYASRGVFVQGNAAVKSAKKMVEALMEVAAVKLDVDVSKLSVKDGGIITDGTNDLSYSEAVVYSHKVLERDILVKDSYANEATRVSYGAHFAEVEVNTETKEIKVVDYVAVHDIGRVMNRLLLEGQLHGGIQMGLGFALSEVNPYTEDGTLKNINLKSYKVFKAKDMPNITVDFVESLDYPGPFGGKSIGECATNPVAPAVTNAIADALDINVYDLPYQMGV